MRKRNGLYPLEKQRAVDGQSHTVSPKEAIRIQERLREKVVTRGKVRGITCVAGVDVGFRGDLAVGAIAVLTFPGLEVCESAVADRPVEFPYIPGLLSFREIPVILDALEKITVTPDVVLCDGQGIAHPRRLGIASHLGVLTGLRTIGVAKSRLVGVHDNVPIDKGDWGSPA